MIFTFSAHFPFRGRKKCLARCKSRCQTPPLWVQWEAGEQVLRPDETTSPPHRRLYRKGGAPHYTVALQKIAAEQGLTVLHAAQDYATREIRTADVNRPGLQLAGFYNYFDPERMQIIGRVESTYLETLTPDQRRERFEQFMRYNIIGLVICHGMDPFPECLEMAEKYDRNLFLVRKDTSEFMADLIAALSSYLAPRLTQHGVLVEVFGEGVLITGDSGVGKSETALELIKRGHRLVADDAVEIKRSWAPRPR